MPPMIGRATELDALVRALERTSGGRGSVALIGGEAGIGKTTLAAEIRGAAEARNFRTLWGRTPEAAWSGPYTPWIELTAPLDGNTTLLFQTDPALSPQDRQVQIHERVLERLRATVARHPALLVLDDLHWAQPATLDLLRHIAFGAARDPLLIVATYRLSAAAPQLPLGMALGQLRQDASVLDLTLSGLDRDELRMLLGPLPPNRIDRILAETKGNPLFATELGRAGDDPLPLPGDRNGSPPDERTVPLSLRQAIAQRMAGLPAPAQRTLSVAAILEDGFELAAIAALTGLTELETIDALDQATIEGFVRPGRGLDEMEFAHAIVRQAVLANWQPSRLVRERRRVAEYLANTPRPKRPGEIASLYYTSRSLPGASAGVSFAQEAAEEARAAASHETTATFLQIALDLSEPADPHRVEFLRGLALARAESLQIDAAVETGWRAIDAMEAGGTDADEIADFSAAIAIALKHRAGATIDQWSPFVTLGLQRVQGARGLGWARLSFVLDPVEPVTRSGIRAGIWTGYDQDAIAIARSVGTEEDQARSYESFDTRTRSETDALLALARSFRTPAARMHALTVAANDLQYTHGAFRDAARIWNELALLAERHGAVAWQAQALNQRALVEIALGDLAEASQTESDANALLMRLGPGRRPELFSMEMATARACYLGGDFAHLAAFWIGFAGDPALGPGESISIFGPFFAALGAFAATESGNADLARDTLSALIPVLEQLPVDSSNHNASVAFAALAAWNLRDPKHAPALRRLLGRMRDAGIQDYPQTSLALSLARSNALLERADDVETAFALAHQQLEASGQMPLRAIANLEQAAWLSERSRPDFDRAATLANSARESFDRLSMPFWQLRAVALLETIAQKAGPATYPAGLTEREMDVLRLTVQGHSDKEISELLFISPRTVNAHMRNMFAKTESANRTELSVWAVGQGLVDR